MDTREWLRQLMIKEDLRAKDIARLAKVSRRTISNLLGGDKVRKSTEAKIVKRLEALSFQRGTNPTPLGLPNKDKRSIQELLNVAAIELEINPPRDNVGRVSDSYLPASETILFFKALTVACEGNLDELNVHLERLAIEMINRLKKENPEQYQERAKEFNWVKDRHFWRSRDPRKAQATG